MKAYNVFLMVKETASSRSIPKTVLADNPVDAVIACMTDLSNDTSGEDRAKIYSLEITCHKASAAVILPST